MCYKVFIVTLAAVSVSSRPQFGFFQPQIQFKFVQVPEGTFYSNSFVQNRAVNFNSWHNAATTNQFLNAEVQEIKTDRDTRETTPKIETYTKQNTEAFVSNNLNRTEDNQNRTANMNSQLGNRKLINERNKESVITNHSPQSTNASIVKSLQTSRRRNSQNTKHREGTTNNMQINVPPNNITNLNQDLYRTTPSSSSLRPQENTQFAQNNNMNNNHAPNVVRANRIHSNLQNNNSNQTHRTNPDYRSNVDINDLNRKTVSNIAKVSNGSTSNSSFQSERPAFTNMKHEQVEKTPDHNKEDDRWVWGYANVTESGITGTTPELDDRANFDGGSCPTGQAKVGSKCVDKD